MILQVTFSNKIWANLKITEDEMFTGNSATYFCWNRFYNVRTKK